jgi:gliding motility-associated-like protein
MKGVWKKRVFRPILLLVMLVPGLASAQCPEVFDFFGNTVDNPYWYSCSGADFTFNLQSPDNWGDYEIDWGDGSPVTTGTSWTSPTAIVHVYPATVDTFVVDITEVNTGCTIQGVVVMEESSSASIQIPVGGLTQACAPQLMEFINSSTNVSETTVFTWDFGDGSPQETYDYTNWGQTVSHTYEQGTVDCETEVALSAENYCNTIQGGASEATFNPIRIWDIDEAAITASATVLCYPDTVVTFTNTTERNCLFQGNIFQRYEYWNFGDYWGEGTDSIIDWTPWPPTFPYTIAYPGIGTYDVMMVDSNYCGLDTAYIQIEIVPPPTADITVSTDTVCVGEPITFFQNASGGATEYEWNFDDGVGWLPTGAGNITYVYNTPGTYNVCSAVGIASSSDGCRDTTCTPVHVIPSPVADIFADDLAGCDQLTVDFDDNSTDAVEWEWTFDVDPFSYIGSDPPAIDYAAPGNYVVNLTVTSLNGCLDSDQELVTIFETPVPDMLADNVCEGEEATFLDLSIADPGDPILSWSWDFGDATTSSFQHPTHTYTSTGTFDVTLTVNSATCSASEVFQVTVEPAPAASASLSPAIGCSPLLVEFTNNSVGADAFTWDFGDGGGSADENPTNVYYNFGMTDTTYIVVMTAMTAFGCGNNDTLEVTVEPGAIASFMDNSIPPSCSPFDAEFINTSQGASSYYWDLGDGTTTTAENPTHTYNNETGFIQTYTVSLIAYAPNGCNDTITSGVTVFPLADFDFTVWPDSGCSPLIITMPYISGVQTYEWDFGDGQTSTFPQPTHLYENFTNDPLVYDIMFVGTSPFGCTDTSYSQVMITPQPTAQFTADINSGCSPITVNFENISIQADFYEWDYGDGEQSTTGSTVHSHTFQNLTNDVVVYEVLLIAHSDDGCQHEFIVPVEVYPQVIPDFEDPGLGCAPFSVTLENTSQNSNSYDWDLGNGLQSIQEFPSTIYINDGDTDTTYTVCLHAFSTYGCDAVVCHDIIVHPSPEALFTMSEESGCHPAPVDIINNSTLADTYEWDYGDGEQSTNSDPVHTHLFETQGSNPIEYEITLIATANTGCSSEAILPYTLYPPVVAAFFADTAGCSPLNAFFSNQSIGANAGFEWDFGDDQSSFQTNPAHTFVNNSGDDITFDVMMVASSIYGCTDTTYQPVVVHPTPIAILEIDTTLGCYPLEVIFQNQSIGADSFTWAYGTGQIGDTTEEYHSFIYYNLGDEPVTYDVQLTAFTDAGCQSMDQLAVDVLPQLQAIFDSPTEACSPFEVSFDNQSIGALSFAWDFGDGDTHTIENPTHTFYNETTEDVTYTVELIVQSYYGCFDTTYTDITVYATPFADFEADPEFQVFPESTVTIENNSVAGVVNYEWDMDDGNELTGINPGQHTYETWGVYQIELVVSNGFCSDTSWRTVEIVPPPPVADFDVNEAACAPITVVFENQSLYGAAYHWDFGDGGSSSAESPVYTYWLAGTYTVSLTVTGFDGVTEDVYIIEDAIEVYPTAVAAFTVTPDEVNVPGEPVYCINLSQNATGFEWDFGDGTTSTEENPVHFYQTEGWYDISLIAFNEWNCPDTMLIVDAVHALAVGYIEFPNAFTPNSSSSSGGMYDPTTYDNDIFFPIHYGIAEYELQIFNRWGELLFESAEIGTGWDGYYKNQMCKEDVYAWKVRARFVDGQEIVRAGDVTLLIR